MSSALTVGVDLGGTKVEIAVVDVQGRIVATSRRASGIQLDPARFVADMVACVEELRADAAMGTIGAVGVGVAGQIDPETGTVRDSPNLGWSNVPLRGHLERALNIPIFVINDVQAATWGEWQQGAGQGVSDLVCLFVGTGIGGGVVAGGRLLTGSTGNAGELGHIVLDLHGPPCHCGNNGCLEAHAGGWAIALRAQQAVVAEPEAGKSLLVLVHGDPKALVAATVAEAAHGGDALARRLVEETGEVLGAGVTSVVNAFNPRLVILGGGVIEGLPELIDMVKESVQRRALAAATASLDIVKAQLGSHSGVIGAALLARRSLAGEV